jgi:hypothetical protein
LLDATRLYHFRWRKKKVEQFIIPPTYFRKTDYSIVEAKKIEDSRERLSDNRLQHTEIVEISASKDEPNNSDLIVSSQTYTPKPIPQDLAGEPKISALSIASIRAKRELQENNKSLAKEEIHLASEDFNETDMLLHWSKYAQRLGDKGHKIMESLLMIGTPKLEGTTIIHELPNAGSKIEFESEKQELLGYLRAKLHNHDITIEVKVNEKVEQKFAFTTQDKYNRLNEINPNLELLKRTFDLDI